MALYSAFNEVAAKRKQKAVKRLKDAQLATRMLQQMTHKPVSPQAPARPRGGVGKVRKPLQRGGPSSGRPNLLSPARPGGRGHVAPIAPIGPGGKPLRNPPGRPVVRTPEAGQKPLPKPGQVGGPAHGRPNLANPGGRPHGDSSIKGPPELSALARLIAWRERRKVQKALGITDWDSATEQQKQAARYVGARGDVGSKPSHDLRELALAGQIAQRKGAELPQGQGVAAGNSEVAKGGKRPPSGRVTPGRPVMPLGRFVESGLKKKRKR